MAPEAEVDPFQTKSKVAQSPTKTSFDPETIDDPFKSKTKIANSPTVKQVSLTANIILNRNTFLIRTFSYAAGHISRKSKNAKLLTEFALLQSKKILRLFSFWEFCTLHA